MGSRRSLERLLDVQPLVLFWAHLLRLYLTYWSLRYGMISARFSIGFPADILQETAVHQSRRRRDWRRNIDERKDLIRIEKGINNERDTHRLFASELHKITHYKLSISRSETLVKKIYHCWICVCIVLFGQRRLRRKYGNKIWL